MNITRSLYTVAAFALGLGMFSATTQAQEEVLVEADIRETCTFLTLQPAPGTLNLFGTCATGRFDEARGTTLDLNRVVGLVRGRLSFAGTGVGNACQNLELIDVYDDGKGITSALTGICNGERETLELRTGIVNTAGALEAR